MPAGTITLTNNSTSAVGSGTSFITELKANDFIVAIVGGVTYTLGVKSVDSATGVTLITAYNGPTASGLSWTAVPNNALVGITAQVAADVAKAIRGLNLDKANWQQVYSASGNITVTLPDGTQYPGPSWLSLSNSLGSKAASGANNDITALNALTSNIEVVGPANPSGSNGSYNNAPALRSVMKGRGANTSTKGGFASLSCGEAIGATGGNGVYGLITLDWAGYGSKYWNFYVSGNANAPGSWVNGSDERHKSNIECVKNPLTAVLSWRGCTYDKLDGDSEVGLIAQDVESFCPKAVINIGRREFSDGKVIEDFKSLNTAGVAAAYHTEAIKALFSLVELALTEPDTALKHIDEIKAAILIPGA
ncbi:tail fiber domain-containing protein [Pantoea sp. ACRSB]|uniref:tail fiber domain-containing protein n=1 Tax=Pantoea sp. ACRSB TaxID=2918207 RepID=UPI0028929947|nr:tail fiber domain-containing protein [Pantoea sp. ACRSB]MCG7388279.1 tail fiber domain-containing protein [Pantoea sp. ACRSB]